MITTKTFTICLMYKDGEYAATIHEHGDPVVPIAPNGPICLYRAQIEVKEQSPKVSAAHGEVMS
jgi:hypothetical protein